MVRWCKSIGFVLLMGAVSSGLPVESPAATSSTLDIISDGRTGEVADSVEPDASRSVLARDPLEDRVAALEVEVAALRAALTDLGL